MSTENLEIIRQNGIFATETENVDKMANKKAPKIDESLMGTNPYKYTLVIPVTEVISNIEFIGIEEGVMMNKSFYIEETPKMELYVHETARSNAAGLSDKAQRMYIHILYSMERKKDYLYMNKAFYMRENKVKSNSTYYEAIKELCRYNYLQKSSIKEVYWINPHRFFPGNRIEKYKECIQVKKKWDKRKEKVNNEQKKPFSFSKKEQEEFETDQK